MPLEEPFMVVATQNPLEQEGTYPLPQSQLDRFMLKLHVGYPTAGAEAKILAASLTGRGGMDLSGVRAVAGPEEIQRAQAALAGMTVDAQILDYALRIVRATRDWPGLEHGAGPRGGIGLLAAGRAAALINGRSYVIPDDIKTMAPPVLRHRVKLSADMELEGFSADDMLRDLIAATPAPRT